ncbi:BMP family ABC transporter substrate-binding protein [Iamia majanohamensis]|uniref:BMP family ABC transporter substrate-binding protein n=1 Tax=Iamia majanohamensis TaxID=467976 RepID=A0AAF0BX71_9ACTN|nr:BMP family ABC transporter substrate-binding protein [Iamia majanohamensis]WCO68708.1 BMP family ABC transporter substrate-binding protein [Iamia majanohamensis]
MRLRRWFRLAALVAVLGLLVAACSTDDGDDTSSGGDSGDSTTEPATCQGEAGQEPSAEPVGGEEADGEGLRVGMVLDVGGVDDDSFNEAANAGLEAAAEDFGVEVQLLEPNEDGSNRGDLLRSLAEDGYDLVIGVGFLFTESMTPIAEEFPDVEFAIIDSVIEADNVTSLVFAAEQGSFLVGAAAALKSQTGQIGFIGGQNGELIQTFQAGFEAGVAEIDPSAEVQVNYLSEPPDDSGFADPASAKTVADGMYADGIDVVYHAAGGSGAGLFESAAAEDRLAIGVDSDQYQQVDEETQPCILTSMLKRVDQAVYSTIFDLVEGDGELEGGVVSGDLESGGIGYAMDGGQLDDINDQLEELQQQIIDGEIEVPATP